MTDKDADKLDAYLGDGTYEKWSELDSDAITELNRAKKLDRMLFHWDPSLTVLSPYGTDWVDKVQNDFAWGFDLITKESKFPDPAQFRPLFEIYPLAIDTASLQMDEAEAIPFAGLIGNVASLRAVGFTIAVKALEQELRELDALLTEALFDQIDTQLKAALGFVIGSVELMVPGLTLLAEGGLALTEFVLTDDTTAKGTKVGKIGLEIIEETEKAGKRVRHFAKGGAKVLIVTGFYFDAEEVLHARKNVKKIKTLMEDARKKYADLSGTLSKAVTALRMYQNHLDAILKPIRREIWAKQRERDDLIQKNGYSLVKPIAWRIIEDLGRFKAAHPFL